MSRFTAKSSLLSVVLLASAMLAPAAIAGPVSAGNSFEIPVVSHPLRAKALYRAAPRHQVQAGSSIEVPLDSMNPATVGMAPWIRPGGGNSFDIPREVGHSR